MVSALPQHSRGRRPARPAKRPEITERREEGERHAIEQTFPAMVALAHAAWRGPRPPARRGTPPRAAARRRPWPRPVRRRRTSRLRATQATRAPCDGARCPGTGCQAGAHGVQLSGGRWHCRPPPVQVRCPITCSRSRSKVFSPPSSPTLRRLLRTVTHHPQLGRRGRSQGAKPRYLGARCSSRSSRAARIIRGEGSLGCDRENPD
jgi:hypothetical protein